MDFVNYLDKNAQKVEVQLSKILSEFLKEVENTSFELVPLVREFVNSCQGGKRIRGVLVRLGYELGKGKDNGIYQVAAAWEILHAGSLIHDDVIDQSQTRRGRPSLYAALGGNHYGKSQAISLGDIGLYLPVKIISQTNILDKYKIKALNHLSQTVIYTGLGEVLDVELPYLGKVVQESDIKLLYMLKTAYYTTSGPLIMGAILAGADQKLIRLLAEFGENLGIAFQIQDDILGVFGQEKQIGKSVSSDIEEGKMTQLFAYVLKKGSNEQRQVINNYYGKGKINSRELGKVREVFRKSGSLDFSFSKAIEYVSKARKIIPKITKDRVIGKLLEEMTNYLVERTH